MNCLASFSGEKKTKTNNQNVVIRALRDKIETTTELLKLLAW